MSDTPYRLGVLAVVSFMLIAGSASSASAAVVSFSAEADDAGQNAVKTYGTDGYDLYATSPEGGPASSGFPAFGPNRITSLPAYITSVVSAGANVYSRNGTTSNNPSLTYAHIVNPQNNAVLRLGLTANQSNSNAEKGLLSFTVAAGAPSSFYIGVITDQGPAAYDQPDSLRIVQSAGAGTGNSGSIALNTDLSAGVDLYFFRITGAQAGDGFTISGVESQLDNGGFYDLTAAGLTFGTAIPEPASLAMFSLASFALLRRLRPVRRNTLPRW